MDDIRSEFSRFQARKSSETTFAGQLAALQLVCGIDLSSALAAGPEEKTRLQHRLRRAIEKERLRGMRRHWSYDLNRHIALKQALDRLCEAVSSAPPIPGPGRPHSAFERRGHRSEVAAAKRIWSAAATIPKTSDDLI